MNNAPRISVLLTAYNREEYIASAIESVLAQSVTDFELIICDDQSSDRTAAIIDDYARRDDRIRVSLNQRNLGDYGNRRHIARLARGEFLKYHDSDDIMYRHCLQAMVEPLEAEPRAAFALSGARAWPGGACPMLLTPRLAYEREFLGFGLFQQGPASALFRTAAFRDLGGFPEVAFAGDYLFWLRACTTANVLLVPGDLFYYRTHAGQELVKPSSAAAYARAAAEAWRMLNDAQCPLSGAGRELAKRNFVFSQARGVYRHCRRGHFAAARTALGLVGLRPADWLTYLRLPRRSVAAGVPGRSGEAAP
ncbi:MAG: glycosyltransferase family 2 protein [Acidobacteria bacterium]|nr:glycosyltransferase family 2 protein [Acidobacteriota bacterium]